MSNNAEETPLSHSRIEGCRNCQWTQQRGLKVSDVASIIYCALPQKAPGVLRALAQRVRRHDREAARAQRSIARAACARMDA
jgi:hypothetical protein